MPSIRDTSIGLGRRTLDLVRRLYPEAAVAITPPHHALVVGAAARRLGIDQRDLLIAFAQSLAMGTLTAAVRCMPVSPAQAQELLVEAHPAISLAVERAVADPEGSLFTCTPALDIRSSSAGASAYAVVSVVTIFRLQAKVATGRRRVKQKRQESKREKRSRA